MTVEEGFIIRDLARAVSALGAFVERDEATAEAWAKADAALKAAADHNWNIKGEHK